MRMLLPLSEVFIREIKSSENWRIFNWLEHILGLKNKSASYIFWVLSWRDCFFLQYLLCPFLIWNVGSAWISVEHYDCRLYHEDPETLAHVLMWLQDIATLSRRLIQAGIEGIYFLNPGPRWVCDRWRIPQEVSTKTNQDSLCLVVTVW